MLEIAVIADDLTGAADTGLQCCPYFTNTTLFSYRNLSSDPQPSASEALAVYTNTRSMKPTLAGNAFGPWRASSEGLGHTKAGAFGRMETLVELHEYWARRNRHER